MKKAKIIGIILISILFVVIFLQNTEAVETKLLFATVTMSRALLLILTFVAGFATGLITMSYMMRKPKRTQTENIEQA
jgi:uncharacterized integral membrane protein